MILIRRLIWDAENVAHIARHQVAPEQVEEACHGEFIIRPAKKGRLLIIAPTRSGLMLAIVLAEEEKETYYVVTARPADRKERRIYEEEKGGERK